MARILFLFCAISGFLHGRDLALRISDLDLPLFDEGRLVRRLMAASADVSGDVSVLKSGTVEFFGPDAAKPERIGTLTFADATYHKAAGVIESDGPMLLHFANGTVAARGFRHELLAGRLLLKSAVVLDFPEARVTGLEGEVLLLQEKKAQDMLVSSATIRGDVAITEFKVKEIDGDRLETTAATYTGSDSMLRPASPVSMWTNGKKTGEAGGKISFRVGGSKLESAISDPPGATPAKATVPPAKP
ncbi:MAG: hypothetical protein ABIZ81_05280 [Opitutaceae bacterium]